MKLARSFAAFIIALVLSGIALAINLVGDEILVDTTTQNDHQSSKIAVLADGSFVITWKDIVDSDIKAQVFAVDGSQVSDQIIVGTSNSSPQITARLDGGFVITWGASGDIKAQIFSADGSKNGDEILVNTTIQNDQTNPQIAALSDDGFVIAWGSGSFFEQDIKAQVFSANGGKIGGEVLVNTATQNGQFDTQIIALLDGGFVITWLDASQGVGGAGGDSSSGAIKAQVFTVDGNMVGGEILVNTATQSSQEEQRIAALTDGGFVITWNDFSSGVGGASGDNDTSIKAQVFAFDGSMVGGEVLVNTATQGGQHDPEITALPDGGFVVVWVDFSHSVGGASGDFSGTAIKGQVFTVDGSMVGDEILVNTTTPNNQNTPQVTALPNGGFVVAWEDNGASGNFNEQDIRVQVFAVDGSMVGGEVLVNTATQNSQRRPEIAVLADDSFVVAWEDNSQAAGDTSFRDFVIKAQVFKVSDDTTTNSSVDSIFNWAESVYNNLFPNHTTSQNIEGYYARLYENGNAVGERDGSIYYYDGSSIILVGEIDDFLPDAIASGF